MILKTAMLLILTFSLLVSGDFNVTSSAPGQTQTRCSSFSLLVSGDFIVTDEFAAEEEIKSALSVS